MSGTSGGQRAGEAQGGRNEASIGVSELAKTLVLF